MSKAKITIPRDEVVIFIRGDSVTVYWLEPEQMKLFGRMVDAVLASDTKDK